MQPYPIEMAIRSANGTSVAMAGAQTSQQAAQVLACSLQDAGRSRAERSRLRLFLAWSAQRQQALFPPDLNAWGEHLLAAGRKPATVTVYLSTVHMICRRELLMSNAFRRALFAVLPPDMSYVEQFVRVENALTELRNALEASSARLSKAIVIQDEADSDFLRLSWNEVRDLVRSPGANTSAGLRNTAIMAMLACTGIRAFELRALLVDDLRQRLGGELALRVRCGKGGKQRLIPYGGNRWCLELTEAWLAHAGIAAGPVFARLATVNRLHYNQRGETAPLSVTSIEQILRRFPIMRDDRPIAVKPHDLRRTYARAVREIGMALDAIQGNLGHVDINVTQHYVGSLSSSMRTPGDAYRAGTWLSNLWPGLTGRPIRTISFWNRCPKGLLRIFSKRVDYLIPKRKTGLHHG